MVDTEAKDTLGVFGDMDLVFGVVNDDSEPPKEIVAGVSLQDLEECCRVLNAVGQHMPFVSSSPVFKPLRKSLVPFIAAEGTKRFGGESKEESDARRRAAQESNREQQQAKARDRKFIENTLLRAGRRAKLDALKEGSDDDRLSLLVPDGLGALPPLSSAAQRCPALLSAEERRIQNEEEKCVDECALQVVGCDVSSGEVSVPCPPPLKNPRACYICKVRFTHLHVFYDQLCPSCAELNYRKRMQTADLSGKIAVLTGARVKIGFRAALKLLRCGATVIATTRFPYDASERFAQERDYEEWEGRLHVVGLDLRDLVALEHFTTFVAQRFGALDIIVNNACQTVRRPRAYYAPQVDQEVELQRAAQARGGIGVLALHNQLEAFLSSRQAMLLMHDHRTLQERGSGSEQAPPDAGPEMVAGGSRRAAAHGGEDGVDEAGGGGASSGAEGQEGGHEEGGMGGQRAGHRSGLAVRGGGGRGGGGGGRSVELAQVALTLEDWECGAEVLPVGMRDVNGQQLDLRSHNSWLLKMEEVSTPEVLEVMTINAVAPFTLNSRLLPLMLGSRHGGGGAGTHATDTTSEQHVGVPKFIVNVSAMEGKFYRYKTPHHPHTNMAKAALNMMTRTAADDLQTKGVYMNAVDTGWINDENPLEKAAKYAKAAGFQTPIDEEDAAARILDPILVGCGAEGDAKLLFGQFLKDYFPTEW